MDGVEAMDCWVASQGNAGLLALPVPTKRTTIHVPNNENLKKMGMKEKLFLKNKMQGPEKVDIRKNGANNQVNDFFLQGNT